MISLLLLLPALAFAELNIEEVLGALSGLSANKKEVKFYNGNKALLSTLEEHSNLKFTTINNADILLFSQEYQSPKALIVNS